ncbi:histidine kinase [Roseateles sp. SL47]|uniref:sensor histidine kinase n=1 Tax=Roseateles sp. SL47 TaxID=2995138 RepID=UPI00226FECCE|nr:sensor histidine kinase [Roseateles sp. SL47]WAC74922.1 histidine kinase [Roseateles sp. SL47]
MLLPLLPVLQLLAAWMLLAPLSASAQITPPALVDFKHDAWSIERGAPSRINSITQTRDGFLWIGSVEGLFRFDGVSFDPIRLESDNAPRLVVSSLLAARNGDLWVGLGRSRGVALWRDGRLIDTQMPNPSREVNDLQEDADGGIWVARGGRSTGTLARFHQGAWQELGPDTGLPAQPIWHLHFARDGTFWVVLSNTLAYRKPGEVRFHLAEAGISPRASLSEDAQGQIWLSDERGIRALQRPDSPDTAFKYPNPVGGSRVLFDRQGDLWTTTWNSGVLRIRSPGRKPSAQWPAERRIAALQATAGLTSDQTRALFQDREGNVWVGTELGLDLLRPASVIVEPDLPSNSPTSYRMAVTHDGVVHVADAHALYEIAPGKSPRPLVTLESPAEALCAAGERGMWLFLADRVLKVEPSGITRLPKPAPGGAYGCAEDTEGRLWMPGLDQGLHVWQHGHWQRWPEPTPSPSLPANAAQDQEGRVVVLFRGPPPPGEPPFIALSVGRSAVGGIEGLLPTSAGLLISGSQGLALAQDAAAPILSASTHPWAASLNGITQTPDGETWAIGDAGIVRMRSADLAAALKRPTVGQATVKQPNPLPVRVFDFKDGLNSFVQKAPGAQVVTGGDGRVWFLTRRNVVRVTPSTLKPNPLPPPVLVRSFQVGDQTYPADAPVTVPAGTTTVRVAFTALSFPVPSRVLFRHRLMGSDDETWSEPSPQRGIVLSDLRPGHYRFEVRASNNDGLWNEQAAAVNLTIPTTLTQSLAFKTGLAVLVALVLYFLYLLRMRHILTRMRERSEDRSRERERIARDIHDTLLQSVQGLILRFHAVAGRLQGDPPTQQSLNQALDRAEAVLVEGRDRLQGLRRASGSDLEHELRRLVEEQPFGASTRVTVSSSGPRRRLRPNVFDEVLCIAGEALFNAAKHAKASEVTVHIDYGSQALEVDVHDNGIGLAQDRHLQPGHFGMVGMQERAARVGALLRINGQGDPGTHVSLRIKARIAYARDSG